MTVGITSRQLGFTLMEVLLATALLGIMMVLLTGSLRIGATSWEAGEERLAKASRLFIVESFLRRHIGTLLPVTSVNSQGEMEPSFRGTADMLSYVAPLPDQLEGGGLYRFQLYVSGQDEHRALRIAIIPYSSGPSQNQGQSLSEPKPVDDLALVEPLEHVKFAYFGPVNDAANPSPTGMPVGKWVQEWREYQLPTLIRIEIAREGEDPWPELLIAPKSLMLR